MVGWVCIWGVGSVARGFGGYLVGKRGGLVAGGRIEGGAGPTRRRGGAVGSISHPVCVLSHFFWPYYFGYESVCG